MTQSIARKIGFTVFAALSFVAVSSASHAYTAEQQRLCTALGRGPGEEHRGGPRVVGPRRYVRASGTGVVPLRASRRTSLTG